jgi:hypothetical protein
MTIAVRGGDGAGVRRSSPSVSGPKVRSEGRWTSHLDRRAVAPYHRTVGLDRRTFAPSHHRTV